MPTRKLNNVLKMDDKMSKKAVHGDLVYEGLEQMLGFADNDLETILVSTSTG